MAFASIIKKLREENHLSQKDLADYLGITRQAVASYELSKRQPDYEILRKIADFFGVSIDYLLGRTSCKDINVLTVAKNIELIKGDMTFEEFSRDIFRKTGTMITPDMLELYVKGEKIPYIGTIRVLAKYASVPESFFYRYNTYEAYKHEKELYIREVQQTGVDYYYGTESMVMSKLEHLELNLLQWIMNKNNLEYLKLAEEIQKSGIPVESIRSIMTVLLSSKRNINKNTGSK